MPECAKLHESLDELNSFTSKKALPVVAPDLNHEELQEAQGGTDAQVACSSIWLQTTSSPGRCTQLKGRLLEY